MKKRKPKLSVDNKLKGKYGEATIEKGKPAVVKINVRKHKGNREELADTIKHELMHVKHPKMHEKTVRKAMPEKMSKSEEDKLISKLRMKKLNYKSGAAKRKLKMGAVKTRPGELITRAKSMSRPERDAIMGLV